MRFATVRAAMRRGWVWPMRPAAPRPSARQIFGQLRRLAGTGLAADDDDLVRGDGGRDLVPLHRHRQLFGKGRLGQGRQPCLALCARRRDLLRHRVDLLDRCAALAIELAQSAQKPAALAGDHAVESGTQRLDFGSIARLHEGGLVPSALRAHSVFETRQRDSGRICPSEARRVSSRARRRQVKLRRTRGCTAQE